MLNKIEAEFICDGCGKRMKVGFEHAHVPPTGCSMFDIATDALRGGLDYEGDEPVHLFCSGSVGENGEHFCAACTMKRDEDEDEEA